MARCIDNVRDVAIDALLAASDGRRRGLPEYISDYADEGDYRPARELAHAAFREVHGRASLHLDTATDANVCLEAAGVLRDGWCPGDPIVLRRTRP